MVFEKMGGDVVYFGKPYPEVYNQSINNKNKKILSVGDNLNTDIKGYISRDGGTTWTQGTFVDEGDWGTNKKIISLVIIKYSNSMINKISLCKILYISKRNTANAFLILNKRN